MKLDRMCLPILACLAVPCTLAAQTLDAVATVDSIFAQWDTRGGLDPDFGDVYRQSAGSSLAASSARVLDRFLNVLPTITIREGHRIKVYLTNDLYLPPFADGARGTEERHD